MAERQTLKVILGAEDAQLQAAITNALRNVDSLKNAQLAFGSAARTSTTAAAGGFTAFADKVKGPLREIATSQLGVAGGFGAIAEQALGALAVGGPVVAAVAAGAAIIGFALKALGDDADEAKKKTKGLIESLNEAADLRANPLAKEVKALRELNAEAAVAEKAVRDAELLVRGSRDRFAGGVSEDAQRKLDAAILKRNEVLRAIGEQNLQLADKLATKTKKVADETGRAAVATNAWADALARLPKGPLVGDTSAADAAAGALAANNPYAQQMRRLNAMAGAVPVETPSAGALDAIGEAALKTLENTPFLRDARMWEGISDALARAFGDALADGLAAGFDRFFATGSIGEGFKAMTGAVLQGLGQSMVQIGKAALVELIALDKIKRAIMSLNPAIGIPIAIALIAAGSALSRVGAAASGSFSQGAGGGGAGVSGSSLGVASSVETAPITYVIPRDLSLNPNDPRVHDWFAETLRQATGRRVIVETA